MHAGRLNGELKLHCFDEQSWHFPDFGGSIHVQNGGFHFWDAVDDFTGVEVDLVYDRDRLYLHNAMGNFGAVPLMLSGNFCSQVEPVSAAQLR